MLTRKQHDLLIYINDYLRDHGISPSFDEMKEALDLRSKSGIHRLISGLEERGFIRRLKHRARALEVVRLPESLDAQRQPEPGFPSSDAAANGNVEPIFDGHRPDTIALPLVGRIAAGTPIEALQDNTTLVDVPNALLATLTAEHYALEVAGDSMIEAGIMDGDTVVIEKCRTAQDGTIVVALVDKSEATLKKIHYGQEKICLEPANAAYEKRILPPERVEVQGKLVGLLRRY